jgi:hypothetical protein
MKRLIVTLALAAGLLAACTPGATPTVPAFTPGPTVPSTMEPMSPPAGTFGPTMSPLVPGAS